MADIAPFAAIRYNADRFGTDITNIVAPPYDILGANDKAALLASDPHNVVAIDLPQVPPKKAGPDALYKQAADTLDAWLADGTMVRDDQPSLYVYHQSYEYGGRPYVRKKVFAALKLEPFGTGKVFPHEHTFGGPKEDRLKLTRTTRCNMSAVFGLFSDPSGDVAERLDPGDREPDAAATLGGVTNFLWRVLDQATIAGIQELLKDEPVYIADGHHRYGTALNYRNWLDEQDGPLPDDHPANYVLIGLCAMEDRGLLILPTHRILEDAATLDPAVLAGASDGVFRIVEGRTADPQLLANEVAQLPDGSIGLLLPSRQDGVLLMLDKPDVLDSIARDHSPAWRKLGYAILHRYVIDELVTKILGRQPTIAYSADPIEAGKIAEARNGLAMITQPTRMDQMRDVCLAGDLMPQKSTFFYPKLLTGMVLNPLY